MKLNRAPAKLSVRLLCALVLAIGPIAPAGAQSSEYEQTGSLEGGVTNPNHRVLVTRLAPSARIAVRTSFDAPLETVWIQGYKDMFCTRAFVEVSGPFGTVSPSGEPHLHFQEALAARLAGRTVASIRDLLLSAEKRSTRAQQFAALFGMPLPLSPADLQRRAGGNNPEDFPSRSLTHAEQLRLNLGQEVRLDDFADGGTRYECLSPAQIDAAIAEAKRVYAAVITAMEGGSTAVGNKEPPPSSTGRQLR